jgi:DUF1365 family protein
MSSQDCAFYGGTIVHQRYRPRRHRLRYALFQLLLDLDEAPRLAGRLALFSYNRFNLFSFHDRDHGDGGPGPLRAWVEAALCRARIDIGGGAVKVLCMPRVFGHVFNPISIYFCHDGGGALAAMIYEVNNTFGQRHSYVIPVAAGAGVDVRQSCAKAFHVSPFMDMAMTYDFRLTRPGDTLSTTVLGRDPEGRLILSARFSAHRRPLSDRTLLGALIAYPLLTLKVVAAIHWEAARLAARGLRLRPAPVAPAEAITVVTPG